MINRAAFILKYKSPAVQWINQVGGGHDGDPVSLEEVNSDRTVYLIADDIADDAEKLEEWIVVNLQVLFESELEEWHTDQNLWPKNLDFALFEEWFIPECHTILIDTLEEPMEDDGL